MNQKHTNFILCGGLVIVILFFAVFLFINQSVDQHITDQVKNIKDKQLSEEFAEVPQQKRKEKTRELTTSDLAPYTITPQRKSDLFKNQQYWDIETRKVLVPADDDNSLQIGNILKRIGRSEKQFDQQFRRVEERIQEYKQKIRDDPENHYARQKLQDLYMLKSTIRILGEKLISNNKH